MHRKLIIKAFEKAGRESRHKGVNKPSNHSLAKDLSDFISNEMNTPIGERRLRDYYKEATAIHNKTIDDINIVQLSVVIGLCNYLGYDDYEAFLGKIKSKKKKKPSKSSLHFYNPI